MTRWARGGPANRKKPLNASDWSDIKAGTSDSSDQLASTNAEQCTKPAKRRKLDGQIKTPKEQRLSAAKSEDVVSELEKFGKKTALVTSTKETIQLEEFVRKDERREARRLKRREMKLQAKVCFNCRQKGHDLASCPQVVGDVDQGTGVCFKCGSTEHKVNQCKAKVPHGKFPFAKCFICGEVGHLSRSCPDNPRGLYPNGGGCNHCGSVEHFKKDCPELQEKKGVIETTLSTLNSKTNVDEEPSLSRSKPVKPSVRKAKFVKF